MFLNKLNEQLNRLMRRFIKPRSPSEETSENHSEQLKIHEIARLLIKNFQLLRKTLQHNSLRRLFMNPQRPWILLVGPTDAGKTSLLRASSLSLQSLSKEPIQTIKPTQLLDWWIGEKAIFADPAGRTILPTLDNVITLAAWRELLKKMRRHRDHYPFNSILLIIDVESIIHSDDEAQANLLKQITRQLQTLDEYHRTLPTTLIITQCDRILGYNEFFADLDPKESEQPIGFTLFQKNAGKTLGERLDDQIGKLLKRINDRLIWRLHHVQNLTKRGHINDFPLQLDRFLQQLKYCIEHLPWNDQIQLHGVYFTSAHHAKQHINLLSTSLGQTIESVPSTHIETPGEEDRPLFIKKLFAMIGNDADFPSAQSKRSVWRRLLMIPFAAAFIFGFSMLWHYAYRDNVAALQLVDTQLKHSQTQSYPDIPSLSRLNALDQSLEAMQLHHRKRIQWTGFTQTQQLQKSLTDAYRKLLIHSFQSYLNKQLAQRIQAELNQNQIALYNTLRIYLMLVTPKQYDEKSLKRWFQRYWHTQHPYDKSLQKKLMHHLNNLLSIKPLYWQVDKSLIGKAQNALKKLPLANIAYLELQGRYRLRSTHVVRNNIKIPGYNLNDVIVPEMFSVKSLNPIYEKIIPEVVNNVVQGDWVLNLTKQKSLDEQKKHQLTQRLRTRYLAAFSKAWLAALQKIKINNTANVKEIEAGIKMLATPDSPLRKLLQLFINNITLQDIDKNLKQNLNSTDVKTIQRLLANDKKFQPSMTKLLNLADYLHDIANTAGIDKASYDASVERFRHPMRKDAITTVLEDAHRLPEPLRHWAGELGLASWKAILANSRVYINSIWQRMVVPEYKRKIFEHYPIFHDSTKNISLKDFDRFFGPDGVLDVFYNYYLKPFVDMRRQYWVWHKVDGLGLNIPQSTLNLFIRGSLIQRMFFVDKPNTPSFTFSLIPLQFSGNAVAATLSVDSQKVVLGANSQSDHNLQWPGPKPGLVRLVMQGKDGKSAETNTHGPWAWFRLVDRSSLKLSNDPRMFYLNMSAGDYSVQMQMITGNKINPFLPGILYKFRCPDNL